MSYNPSQPPYYPPPAPESAYPTPETAKNSRPDPALANLAFFIGVLAFLAMSVVAQLGNWGFALTSVAGELMLVLVAVLFCVGGRFNFKETFSLRKMDWATLGICIIAGLIGQFAVRFPAALNQWVMQIFGPFPTDELIPTPKDTTGRILLLIVVAGVAPICEETLNRGFVLAGYRRLSFGKTILFVGLLFGLFHLYPFRFAYTFLLGMALAYLVLVTGSIYSSIAAHFGFNLIGGLSPWILDWLQQMLRDNGRALVEDQSQLDFASVITTLPISLAAGALFILLLRIITRRMARQRPELELGYLGLARNIRTGQSSAAGATGPYYGPDRRFNYGRYGYCRAPQTMTVPPGTAYPMPDYSYPPAPWPQTSPQLYSWDNPPALRPRLIGGARLWWQISFGAIIALYLLTSFSEISIRFKEAKNPAKATASVRFIELEPNPGYISTLQEVP